MKAHIHEEQISKDKETLILNSKIFKDLQLLTFDLLDHLNYSILLNQEPKENYDKTNG